MFQIIGALLNGINLWFTLSMSGLFTYAVFILFKPNSGMAHQNLLKAMPTLLTSIGIFGTFLGIVMALLHFDSNHIRENIDQIINGMQTAFLTSVLGVFLSLVLKISTIWVEGKRLEADNETDEISNEEILGKFIQQTENSEEMVRLLNKLGQVLHKDSQNLAEHLSALRQVITNQNTVQTTDWHKIHETISTGFHNLEQWQNNNNNATVQFRNILFNRLDELSGSLKAWQSEWKQAELHRMQKMAEFENRLKEQLDNFAEILSKSATEQIIDALRQVIKDFNDKLPEQFGENFKQLNQAVGELVTWQENYKQQLNQMAEQYAQGVRAITQTEQAVASIEESAQAIPETMANLDDVMRVNQQQINELERHLQAFEIMRDKAVQAVPQIQQHIDNVLKNMVSGSQALQTTMQTTAQSFSSQTRDTLQQLDNTADYIKTNSERINRELTQAAQQFADNVAEGQRLFEQQIEQIQAACNRSITETANHLAQENQRVLKGLEQHAERALNETGDSLQRQLNTMNNAVNEELRQVTEALGGNLLTLINAFTRDYRQLVDRMTEIVQYGQRKG